MPLCNEPIEGKHITQHKHSRAMHSTMTHRMANSTVTVTARVALAVTGTTRTAKAFATSHAALRERRPGAGVFSVQCAQAACGR